MNPDKIIEQTNAKRERRNAEKALFIEAVGKLAEKKINVIDVSTTTCDNEDVAWCVVEFSIGNGKWTKFPVPNYKEYPSDFLNYIIEIVESVRKQKQMHINH